MYDCGIVVKKTEVNTCLAGLYLQYLSGRLYGAQIVC